jgi:single-stranded-DNA-specific exonuclease
MGDARSRWVVAPSDAARAAELATAVGVSPIVGQLLLNRGVGDAEAARRYLVPRLGDLRRPDGEQAMRGFATAAARLERALVDGELVGVFGDYDVDGVTSCALLTLFLRDAGGRVVARVARRDAGYGFSPADVDELAASGCALVVTCDCGTSDHDALARARARGIDVIVVDHHQVPARDPDALALLNSHQPACRFPFKGLASVGVAFYLAAALRTRLRARGWPRVPDPRALTDLVAVGTIADLAPLTDENRVLVHGGLARLRPPARPGLRALAELADLPDGVRRAADVGLRIGPRLNAPGRLGDAQLALDLLLASDAAEARALAAACEQANVRRRDVQERVLKQAIAEVEARRADRAALVVAGEGWHPGVVGIVAAKLVDRYARPAVVIALDGTEGRGSARTVPGVDLYRALEACGDLLVRFGGHAAAAGLTVDKARLLAFAARFEAAVAAAQGGRPPARELAVDAEIDLAEVDAPLAEELARLEPFGIGNPEPLFGTRGVVLERTRVVGATHLQVTLRDGLHARDGIGFHLAERAPGAGERVRAAYFPEVDCWQGLRRVRVRLRDLSLEDA